MANIYCGNNALFTGLVNGTHQIGTRYQCLRKGIGIGSNLDPYEEPYEPIDDTRIYCGKQNILPNGYDRLGTPPECLRRGIGVGKGLQNAEVDGNVGSQRPKCNKNFYGLLFLIAVITFLVLYTTQPLCVTEVIDKKTVISWKKFTITYIIVLFFSYIFLYILF